MPSKIVAHEVEEIGILWHENYILVGIFQHWKLKRRWKLTWSFNSWSFSCYMSTGVEHLLRDVKDTTISTLATEDLFFSMFLMFSFLINIFCWINLFNKFQNQALAFWMPISEQKYFKAWRNRVAFYCVQVVGKLTTLNSLGARLQEICDYLDLVVDGKIPLNNEILYHLQI